MENLKGTYMNGMIWNLKYVYMNGNDMKLEIFIYEWHVYIIY